MTDPLEPLEGRPFWIMDGAGNDFVIVDLRDGGTMTTDAARALGDRSGPYGCDQVIGLIEGPAMRIWNADGSEAGACGNAARCIASLLFDEEGGEILRFGSPSGELHASRASGQIEVDMGAPRLGWRDIPLSEAVDDTIALPLPPGLLQRHGLEPPAGVSMGNPHAVFFVTDAEATDLAAFGPTIENHALFPERCNVSVVSREDGGLRLRTWERGVGITRACGTAACATLVSAARRGLTGRSSAIRADGGTLHITWDEKTGHVLMAGPVQLRRKGVF
ncbi:diaminopimelate epimerase [Parvularcula lutaonensis]|uniref:Diaminopimelate epimerase n=1 Tax=Parvularcula lutaonensis TaxID=491923 RepID=A0ABV7M9W5_9PROT|nr:diaminopimelate epimerase [Parvularcula lutaonensis]GGY47466.1 diaminopimelate epimerase [Parvularcula lutaonensis]